MQRHRCRGAQRGRVVPNRPGASPARVTGLKRAHIDQREQHAALIAKIDRLAGEQNWFRVTAGKRQDGLHERQGGRVGDTPQRLVAGDAAAQEIDIAQRVGDHLRLGMTRQCEKSLVRIEENLVAHPHDDGRVGCRVYRGGKSALDLKILIHGMQNQHDARGSAALVGQHQIAHTAQPNRLVAPERRHLDDDIAECLAGGDALHRILNRGGLAIAEPDLKIRMVLVDRPAKRLRAVHAMHGECRGVRPFDGLINIDEDHAL